MAAKRTSTKLSRGRDTSPNPSHLRADALRRIRRALEDVLRELARSGLEDRDLRHRYAEYMVASKLAERGRKICLLGHRRDTGADIYLADINKRVEVKSSTIDEHGCAYASFQKGRQIREDRFDYCVFVRFGRAKRRTITDCFVFKLDELTEVTEARPRLAAHPDSNPCLLICAPNLRVYKNCTTTWGVKTLGIERKLSASPRTYKNAWSKIT